MSGTSDVCSSLSDTMETERSVSPSLNVAMEPDENDVGINIEVAMTFSTPFWKSMLDVYCQPYSFM